MLQLFGLIISSHHEVLYLGLVFFSIVQVLIVNGSGIRFTIGLFASLSLLTIACIIESHLPVELL